MPHTTILFGQGWTIQTRMGLKVWVPWKKSGMSEEGRLGQHVKPEMKELSSVTGSKGSTGRLDSGAR